MVCDFHSEIYHRLCVIAITNVYARLYTLCSIGVFVSDCVCISHTHTVFRMVVFINSNDCVIVINVLKFTNFLHLNRKTKMFWSCDNVCQKVCDNGQGLERQISSFHWIFKYFHRISKRFKCWVKSEYLQY